MCVCVYMGVLGGLCEFQEVSISGLVCVPEGACLRGCVCVGLCVFYRACMCVSQGMCVLEQWFSNCGTCTTGGTCAPF